MLAFLFFLLTAIGVEYAAYKIYLYIGENRSYPPDVLDFLPAILVAAIGWILFAILVCIVSFGR